MKRNILTILIITLLIGTFIQIGMENAFLNQEIREITNNFQTAVDMALLQTQTADDFFKANEGYNLNNRVYEIQTLQGKHDLFRELTGETNKERIYDNLYTNNTEFDKFINQNFNDLQKIKSTHKIYNKITKRIEYKDLPTIARMGGDTYIMFQNPEIDNNYIEQTQIGKKKKTLENQDYYSTPLAEGIAYVDPEILNKLIMNNFLLQMEKSYGNVNSGIFKGTTWSDQIPNVNMIKTANNGEYTLVLGRDDKHLYTGTITPKISYKLINVYDPANNHLLQPIFGRTAEQIKEKDRNNIDPRTGLQPTSKYTLIAKIEAKAEVIIHYQTPILREMALTQVNNQLGKGKLLTTEVQNLDPNNYADIKQNNKRFRTIEYSRLFGILN